MPPESRGGPPSLIGKSGYFQVNPSTGEEITRPASCQVCRKDFLQRHLSERFLTIVEKRGARCMALLRKAIPDLWCPVYCPSCERLDLGQFARISEREDYMDRGAA